MHQRQELGAEAEVEFEAKVEVVFEDGLLMM